MQDDAEILANFTGIARLFPLPSLVLFPHVIQGLHIFEPRYREMLADTISDDMLMALVLLKPGWEQEYDGHPAIENVACLGRVGPWERLSDGRYNLKLRGLSRIRIVGELDSDTPYRIAEVEVMADEVTSELAQLKAMRQLVADAVLPRFAENSPTRLQVEDLFHGETPVGPLTDMLSYALPLPLEMKQRLLAESDVSVRCEILADALKLKSSATMRKFPPDFSMN
ncbi:LON peptidase substrate-binding domain-containing protein [soil metagenome]